MNGLKIMARKFLPLTVFVFTVVSAGVFMYLPIHPALVILGVMWVLFSGLAKLGALGNVKDNRRGLELALLLFLLLPLDLLLHPELEFWPGLLSLELFKATLLIAFYSVWFLIDLYIFLKPMVMRR